MIYEYFYTKQLTSDVINMYSVSFLENINSFDELYDALNISDKEKNLLKNNEDAYNTWIQQDSHNPLKVLIYLTPLGDQIPVTSSRILWLSTIDNNKKNYNNSFEKYKQQISTNQNTNIKDILNKIMREQKEYIQHLSVLLVITSSFEIIWLILLININSKEE